MRLAGALALIALRLVGFAALILVLALAACGFAIFIVTVALPALVKLGLTDAQALAAFIGAVALVVAALFTDFRRGDGRPPSLPSPARGEGNARSVDDEPLLDLLADDMRRFQPPGPPDVPSHDEAAGSARETKPFYGAGSPGAGP